MPDMNRRKLLATLAVAPLAVGVVGQAAGAENKFKVPESSREKLRKRYFPNFELTTHEGKKVRFYDDLIKDKFVTLNFVYTSCTEICPITTENLAQVQKILKDRVGTDLFMYSISLDPEHDRPEVLKKFAKTVGVGPGWLFVTAERRAITERLRRSLGYVNPIPEVDRDKVLKQGIDLGSVYQTLQAFMGVIFVNYFNRFGRVWQVYVPAEGDFRTDAETWGQFRVRTKDGESLRHP